MRNPFYFDDIDLGEDHKEFLGEAYSSSLDDGEEEEGEEEVEDEE